MECVVEQVIKRGTSHRKQNQMQTWVRKEDEFRSHACALYRCDNSSGKEISDKENIRHRNTSIIHLNKQ